MTTWRRRRAAALTAALVASLAAAGCGLLPDKGGPVPGVISIAVTDPGHLLPSEATQRDERQVLAALFTPLVRYDSQHRPVPLAAQSITSSDNKVWHVTLAPGYTFHDGEPVTADSYLTAWNYAAYGPNQQRNAYFFDRVQGFADLQGAQPAATAMSGLRKVDEHAFDVTLSAPFADFPAMLGSPAFLPLPAGAFSAPGVLRGDFESRIVGQGPFRLVGTWQHGAPIQVERVDGHPHPAQATKLEFRVYPAAEPAYEDLVAGDLDVDASIPDTKVAQAAATLGDRYQVVDGSTVNYLAFPGFQPQFADVRVRRAISLAIDRDALVNTYFPGTQQAARSFVPPVVPGYRAGSCTACRFDPTTARALYAEAKGPATVQISYNSDGGHRAWVEATCAQLVTNLGIGCTPVAEPTFDSLLGKVRQQAATGLFRMSWAMDYPSMESYLTPLFTTSGSSNYFGYHSADLDAAVRQASAARTPDAAVAGYQQAEGLLGNDMPVLPLRYDRRGVGHTARVGGISLDPFEVVDPAALTLAS